MYRSMKFIILHGVSCRIFLFCRIRFRKYKNCGGLKSIKNGNSEEENPTWFITDMLDLVPGVLQVGTLHTLQPPLYPKSEQCEATLHAQVCQFKYLLMPYGLPSVANEYDGTTKKPLESLCDHLPRYVNLLPRSA